MFIAQPKETKKERLSDPVYYFSGSMEIVSFNFIPLFLGIQRVFTNFNKYIQEQGFLSKGSRHGIFKCAPPALAYRGGNLQPESQGDTHMEQ